MFLAARRLVERGGPVVRPARGRPRDRADGRPLPPTRWRRWSTRLTELVLGPERRDRDAEAEQLRRGRAGPARPRAARSPASDAALGALDDRRPRAAARRAPSTPWRRSHFTVADRLRLDWLRDRDRRAASRRSMADRGARRVARRPRRLPIASSPMPCSRPGTSATSSDAQSAVDAWIDAASRRREPLRAVRRRDRSRAVLRPRAARPRAASSRVARALRRYRAPDTRRDAVRPRAPRGPRWRRTRRAHRHPGVPRPNRGTGRVPASRPGRARAPAGTRAVATTPWCRRRARPRRGWHRAPRARAATGGAARVIERAEPRRLCLDLGFHPVGERPRTSRSVPLAGQARRRRRRTAASPLG